MRSCPKCRRDVPEDRRVCRACYTVLPEIDPAVSARKRKRAKRISGLVQVLILFGVAGAAWMFQFNIDLFPGTHFAMSHEDRSQAPARNVSGGAEQSAAATPSSGNSTGGQAGKNGYQPVSKASVGRQGSGCAISQRVRNDDASAISPVALHFTFEDTLGKQIGPAAEGVVREILAPGTERTFTFHVPCPRAFASAKVRPWQSKAKVSDPGIAFAGGPAGGTDADGPMVKLAVKVPQATACRSSEPCRLVVLFKNGAAQPFNFRRDPHAEDVLIADDPQLTDHLRKGGTAQLLVPTAAGVGGVTLTDEYLRKPEASGQWAMFTRWIRNLL